MKLKNIIRAASVLLAGSLSGQAFALLPPSPTTTGTLPQFTLYSSGASAQQKTIRAMFNSYCNADLHIFQDQPWNSTTNLQVGTAVGAGWQAFFCTFKTDPLVVTDAQLRGQRVLVLNRAKGGSVWGVVPLQKNIPVEQMNIFRNGSGRDCTQIGATNVYNCKVEADTLATALAVRPGTAVDATLNSRECIIGAAVVLTGTSLQFPSETTTGVNFDTVCRSSHAGISDVEPAMFAGAPNRPVFPLPPALLPPVFVDYTLTAPAAYGVLFGVTVGWDVYDQLQINQGLTTATGGSCAGIRTIDSPCQPSLTKSEITAIFSGDITSWAQLGMGTLGQGTGELAVCRRVVGSGTQAAANAYFMGNPCLTGAPGGKKDFVTAAATDGIGYAVVEGSGSGNVIACHNAAFAGNVASPDAVGITGVTGGIGIQALEKLPGALDRWAYIRINGVSPTTGNYLNGQYDNAYENTIQYNSTLVTTSREGRLVLEIQAQAPNPTFLKSAGVTGVAALCSLGFAVSPGTATTAPVTRMTRAGNSCNATSVCP